MVSLPSFTRPRSSLEELLEEQPAKAPRDRASTAARARALIDFFMNMPFTRIDAKHRLALFIMHYFGYFSISIWENWDCVFCQRQVSGAERFL